MLTRIQKVLFTIQPVIKIVYTKHIFHTLLLVNCILLFDTKLALNT